MTLIEAAKQAREAMKYATAPNEVFDFLKADEMLEQALAALDKAIANAEQQPDHTEQHLEMVEQKPVAWLTRRYFDNFPLDGYETCDPTDYGAFPAFTYPPKREWQGLTNEEIKAEWVKVIDQTGGDEVLALARAIEAKLKEKNT